MTDAVRHLFEYDASLPLDVSVVGDDRYGDAVVTEIRFAGARGGKVAAYVVEMAEAPPRSPGVVYAHGGHGPGKHGFVPQAVEVARAGIRVVLPDTSMPSNMPSPETIDVDERAFGDAVLVQRRALDVLTAHGTERLGFFGYSFGGMLAAVLACVEPRLEAVVIGAMGTGLEWARDAGFTNKEFLERVERLDPIHYVTPPGRRHLLVQQGRRDQANPVPRARALFNAAAPPKYWAEYDCEHDIDVHPPAVADRIAFFRERLLAG